MSDTNEPVTAKTGSFAEQCDVATFDLKSGQTTSQSFGVNNPDDCVKRGIAAASFNPNAMAPTYPASIPAPSTSTSTAAPSL